MATSRSSVVETLIMDPAVCATASAAPAAMTRLVNTTKTILLIVLLPLSSMLTMAARALTRSTTRVVRGWALDRGPTACIGSPPVHGLGDVRAVEVYLTP